MRDMELFTECGKGARFQIREVIGRGKRSLVRAAVDTHTGERVAIKKISNIFDDVSDAKRILREIKLLRLLRHPDIVEIKHIVLPPSPADFEDIFIVFELMESDLHQVLQANEDLTQDHHRYFLYQLLRALKYIHTANVINRGFTPKSILANADCKLKISSFTLARASFGDALSTIFWSDDASTRWYRPPELCGSFFGKYSTKLDIWSVGCVFAEMLTRKPLFPGKNMFHQLDLITSLLGTPSAESITGVRNANARKYLSGMKKKSPVPFSQAFPSLDPLAVCLLERLIAFDPCHRPSAEEALADPYFFCLANVDHEPTAQPLSAMHFEFENKKLMKEDVRELVYQEVLEYHPAALQKYVTSAATRKGSCLFRNGNLDENKIISGKSEASACASTLYKSQEAERDEQENAQKVDSVESKPDDRDQSLSVNEVALLSTSSTPRADSSRRKFYENQYDATAWLSIKEEADRLTCMNERSGHLSLSNAKAEVSRVSKGERGKAKPRFSIRSSKESSETEPVPSMTELLEQLTRKGNASVGPSNREINLEGRTMADLFQQVFSVSTEDVDGGLSLSDRSTAGYSWRLQQIMQREKDRHTRLLKQMANNQLRGVEVEILFRVLDAKSVVCRCLLYDEATVMVTEEMGEKTERTIIFSPKICGNVELQVGNRISMYPPWKEVITKEGDVIILCAYFSRITQ